MYFGNAGTNWKSLKQGLTSSDDQTIELPKRCQSPYHMLDN